MDRRGWVTWGVVRQAGLGLDRRGGVWLGRAEHVTEQQTKKWEVKMSKKTEPKSETIHVPAPSLKVAEFKLKGISPYVSERFSEKAKQMMHDTHTKGSAAKKDKKKEPRDFQKEYEMSKHIDDTEGWCGIPATAFRNAMISACRLVGFKMTIGKLTIFPVGDGIDKHEGTALVRIYGEPTQVEHHVRNFNGVADLRARAMFKKWTAKLKIEYDADQFTLNDLTNLLLRAGLQVGVGAGRPDSKSSSGMGWGRFTLEGK